MNFIFYEVALIYKRGCEKTKKMNESSFHRNIMNALSQSNMFSFQETINIVAINPSYLYKFVIH